MTAQRTSMSLHDAHEHVSGLVTTVSADAHTVGLLEGLGICEGRSIRLVRRGDSYILSVYGTRVGLAAAVAGTIFIEPHA